jgi:shikimate kinase
MARLMEQRYPVYATADITIQTRDDRREVIAAEVLEALNARLSEPGFAPKATSKAGEEQKPT